VKRDQIFLLRKEKNQEKGIMCILSLKKLLISGNKKNLFVM